MPISLTIEDCTKIEMPELLKRLSAKVIMLVSAKNNNPLNQANIKILTEDVERLKKAIQIKKS